MITIIDYGVGNLFSIKSSLKFLGFDSVVSNNPEDILNAKKIILPGVGAFGDAIKKLNKTGLVPYIQQAVKNGSMLLGICLGMQLLFEEGHEYGIHKGLGFLQGKVVPFNIDKSYKIPHMGWNSLEFVKDSPLLKYIKNGDSVYYVHSYLAVDCQNSLVATSNYACNVTGIVQNNNVFGTQFHPEKSGSVGLNILKAFCELEVL